MSGSKGSNFESYASIVKGTTDSAFILDEDRKILEFNRPFVKLHEVEPRNVRGIHHSLCREHVDLEICENQCILKTCLEANDTVRFDEVKGRTRSGEELTLIVTAIPIKDADGKIVSVLEIQRNVSDEAKIHDKYKVLFEKEKKAKETLEKLVEERTSALKKTNEDLKATEAKLVHSEKMSSLGQMVAGLAHELNNPINFISGNVDILEEYSTDIKHAFEDISAKAAESRLASEDLDAVLEKYDLEFKIEDMASIATSIRKGSERATDVISGLRTFSRLDEAQLKETDIHQDIDTTLMLLRNQYKDRITVHKEYGALEPVRCFSSQLNQVYMNLLQNAIHAIKGPGDIWIRTRLTENELVLEFADSGEGIPKDIQKKIFDPFFTTKKVGEGTGLGLSVSYGIIERHQGSIEVQSEPGSGTTFVIKIPRKIELQE